MDIFEFAMQMEKDGEAMYREIADRSAHHGIKNIFTMLADDEKKHYIVFEKMKEGSTATVDDTQVLENTKNIFMKIKENKENIPGTGPSHKAAYENAREIEKKSIEFYESKAEKVEGRAQKDMIIRIAEEEKKHAFLVENMIEFISRPESWVEDAEFNHLEEY
ncbi:ferritin family protein [Spirochaetota bacterium]